MTTKIKHYVTDGEIVTIQLAHSEVCIYMQVAGKVMSVRFYVIEGNNASVQLLDENGNNFSYPICPGEAGFYFDGQYYCYPATEVK